MYQRWIYRVDMSRVNEFGFSGTVAEEREAAAAAAAAAVAGGAAAAALEVSVCGCQAVCGVALLAAPAPEYTLNKRASPPYPRTRTPTQQGVAEDEGAAAGSTRRRRGGAQPEAAAAGAADAGSSDQAPDDSRKKSK
jgi:hypothetical protein